MKFATWEDFLRRLIEYLEEWGPLIVSVYVLGVFVFMLILALNSKPSGAIAAVFALITATAVFARILAGTASSGKLWLRG